MIFIITVSTLIYQNFVITLDTLPLYDQLYNRLLFTDLCFNLVQYKAICYSCDQAQHTSATHNSLKKVEILDLKLFCAYFLPSAIK